MDQNKLSKFYFGACNGYFCRTNAIVFWNRATSSVVHIRFSKSDKWAIDDLRKTK